MSGEDVLALVTRAEGREGPSAQHRQDVRLRTDGKFFACGQQRFPFRGVTYGTFRTRADGALFPESEVLASDLRAISEAGFTVVRTYTPPPPDLLDLAADCGMKVFAGAFFEDWRYMLGSSRRERLTIARRGRRAVQEVARRLAGDPTVAALSIGNEIPADVVRWVGTAEITRLLGELVEAVRAMDPELLISYASYPTTEYLVLPELDFLTFNVFLEREADFRAYLTRLHNLAGDRPLVLGEIGLDSGRGEADQARALDWQLASATERGVAGTCIFSWTDEWWVADRRVEGWSFGLTTAERRPKAALKTAARWNRRGLADLRETWPEISVVICAYNAAATLEECLRHVTALDYRPLQVIVVDDGSTDETAEIARAHPEVELLSIPAGGLSNARNVGTGAARGEIVAYLDSDAFPPPEWPYLIALSFDSPGVGGTGGPNLPPIDDPLVAQAVARAPGGPVHVLLSDDRAEHVPGCNMAFWRELIGELDGFDPVFTAAGDDVDFCWRVLDAGWSIAFHPAAFVWHHRRATAAAYLRQQRGYGRAESLVQARHPERFTPAGTARWRGTIYDSMSRRLLRAHIYHGQYAAAAYQSVYRGSGHGLDLAHQLGVPVAVGTLPLALLALVIWPLGTLALPGILWLAALFVLDMKAIGVSERVPGARRVRALAALLHLLQPLQRLRGRLLTAGLPDYARPAAPALPGPAQRLPGGVLLLPLSASRQELTGRLVSALAAGGCRIAPAGPWDDFDACLPGSSLLQGRLLSSAHPEGSLQVRIDLRLRPRPTALLLVALLVLALTLWPLAAVLAGLAGAEVLRGWWRGRVRPQRVLSAAAAPQAWQDASR